MGIYINRGNESFRQIRRSEYVDKSGLIAVVNSTLFTRQKFSCVTRCRRFGKSMAAEMLAAYYDHSCQSRDLFADLQIAHDPSFEEHLNKYPVIFLDMTSFITRYKDATIVDHIQEALKADLHDAYPQVELKADDDAMAFMQRIALSTGERFVFIIDEWDAICREFSPGTKAMDRYVNWLRRMFKGVESVDVFAAAYLTGILPIKKYKTESALNNFLEYSMVEPRKMAKYFGFTKDEVQALAEKHGMDFDELEQWYDGYQIGDEPSVFNPNSVMQAVDTGRCRSFWASTGAFDAIAGYISMNFDGLKDDIISLLTGGRVKVNTTKFQNDLSVIQSRDDVLTVLIHLGYLSFNWRRNECHVPNYEVQGELANAVENTHWTHLTETLKQSERLLESALNGDAETVARAIDVAHSDKTSILSYNNENSMACVLAIAFYAARADYVFHRELPTGKGFADLVLLPRKYVSRPAMVLELKYDGTTGTAIDQIRERRYPEKVAQHTDNLLLVAVSYNREQKTHECRIEKL
jgi:hypothetical protein